MDDTLPAGIAAGQGMALEDKTTAARTPVHAAVSLTPSVLYYTS